MYLPGFPNTVWFTHSNTYQTIVSISSSTVNSTGECVTRTDFFHYTQPGTYTITISVHKAYQLLLLSEKTLFTKTFTIGEINEFSLNNLGNLNSPIRIDSIINMEFSVRFYAMKYFYVQFGDDTDSELVANHSTTEGNLLRLGPSVNSSTISSQTVSADNTAEYLLLSSLFTERVYIQELSVFANSSGLIEFSVWKIVNSCNDSRGCVDYLSQKKSVNDTEFIRKFSFKVTFILHIYTENINIFVRIIFKFIKKISYPKA